MKARTAVWVGAVLALVFMACEPEPKAGEARPYLGTGYVKYMRDGDLCFAGVSFSSQNQHSSWGVVLIPCEKMPINKSR